MMFFKIILFFNKNLTIVFLIYLLHICTDYNNINCYSMILNTENFMAVIQTGVKLLK